MEVIEIWKPIPGYEGLYEVSTHGRVKSYKRAVVIVLKARVNKEGYLYLGLCKDGEVVTHRVHRLVAVTFIPNAENKPEVNHKNGVRHESYVENLEWVTRQENVDDIYKVRKVKIKCGIEHRGSKPVYQFTKTGKLLNVYPSVNTAAEKTGARYNNISQCAHMARPTAGGFKWSYNNSL